MLLSDETDGTDRALKQEGLPVPQRQVSRGTKAHPHLVLLIQYPMILEQTRTKDRTTVSESGLPINTVTTPKPPATSGPEMGLITIEEVNHREEDHKPLEVSTPMPDQPLGCLRKRKPTDWLLASALCVERQGISAAIVPPNEQ